MPIVEVPGLGEVEFPDGMSKADMGAAVRKTLAARTTKALEEKYPQYLGPDAEQSGGIDLSVGGALQGVGNTIKGLYDAASRVVSMPQSPRDWALFGAMGPLGPLVGDMAQSHIDTGKKAVDAVKKGEYTQAGGYALATALPVMGPATAATAEKIGEGKLSEAGGEIVSGALLPKVLSKVKSVRVSPKVKTNLTPEDAAANAYARSNNVRLDAATETGSKLALNAQKHVSDSLGGSGVAQEFRAGQIADLDRAGTELANKLGPAPMTPEGASNRVKGELKDRISTKGRDANQNYKTLRDIEADPVNLETIQTGLDKDGKPVFEEMPLPVDHRPMKQALKPIEREFQRVLTPAEQRADPTLHAIREIVNGPDFLPASAAEKNLGALKQFRHSGDGGVNIAEGLAAKVIREYDQAIRAKVQGAQRSAKAPAAPPPLPGNAAASPGAAPAAAAPNPNLTGVVGSQETHIGIPDEAGYKARYEVRELDSVQASHNGQNFQKNPNYQLTNDRDYSRSLDDQKKVIDHSTDFKPAELVNDAPNGLTGPPVIDADGNVLGGNGRTMTIGRVYGSNPEGAAAYRAMVEGKAAQFGIDPASVKGMKQPVLVRVVDDLPDAASRQNAVTGLNKKFTAELRPSERAIADARKVSQSTLDDIGGRIAAQGDDGTLAKALEGPNGGPVIDALIKDGVISASERGALVEGLALTKAGKDRIGSLLVGRFFKDPAQLDNAAPAVRSRLERIAAPLAKAEGVEGWGLTGHVQDAMDLLDAARSAGTPNLDDFLRQGGLFGESRYSPQAVQFARKLQAEGPRKLEAAARRYASDAEYARGGDSLFGDTVSPAEAFEGAFGGAIDNTPVAPGAPGAAGAAAAPAAASAAATPAAAAAPAPRILISGKPAGAEAMGALKAGRLATYEKWRADRILKRVQGLKDEPVAAYEALTRDKDRSIAHLRRVEREAPAVVEDLGRAYFEGMLEDLRKGEWANGKTIESQWNKLGDETKKILFKNPALRQNVNEFVRLVKNTSKNPNPSGTAAVTAMRQHVLGFVTGLGMTIAVPTAGMAQVGIQGGYILSNRAIAKMLFTPKGSAALQRGLRVPIGNKAAATIAAGQLLKLAGPDAQPLPAAAGNRNESNESLAAVASR